MKDQEIVICANDTAYKELINILRKNHIKHPLLVCRDSAHSLNIYQFLKSKGIRFIEFSGYEPNPSYDSVVNGVQTYKNNHCDGIIAIAGGSGLDVAKCIKMYASMKDRDYLSQKIEPNRIKMIAIPTTAGTGSESTKYSIIYVNGSKQTITHESSIPEYVFLDGSVLKSLPEYHRKATMLDALAHAIESYWSCNSTEESKKYAGQAIIKIYDSMSSYLDNTDSGNAEMLYAANLSGRAINVTGTTAPHAMCYKLTKKYNLAHGHAVALTLPHLWHYMINNLDKTIDSKGRKYVETTFQELAKLMEAESPPSAVDAFRKLILDMGLETHVVDCENSIEELVTAVDVNKLQSTPVKIEEADIRLIYKDLL